MDVKDAILQAGVTLLKQQGIVALTQPKVAKAAGVKQSHLTYYFPKRTDLLLGIAEHSLERITTDLAARLQHEPPQMAFAETVIAAIIEGIPPRLMLGLIVAADSDPELHLPLRKLIRHIRERIQGILERAGVADSKTAALQFHATVVGLAVMHEAQRTTESAGELKQGLNGILQLLGVGIPGKGKDSP